MSHLYPRQCDERPFLAVSNLAFRRHLLTHHHILLEMRDGREEFRRLPPDEAAHRCQVVRGRRRGRQCRAQAEGAGRRRLAAPRHQQRRRPLATHLRIIVRPTIFRLDTCPTLRRTSSSSRRPSRKEWRACRSYRLSAGLLCRRPRWCRIASC